MIMMLTREWTAWGGIVHHCNSILTELKYLNDYIMLTTEANRQVGMVTLKRLGELEW